MSQDPFHHHPELRPLIQTPDTSPIRKLTLADIDAKMISMGIDPSWRRPDHEIEELLQAFLAQHGAEPIWIFGYGSLMWDPAIHFSEVRRASVAGYARSLCLLDVNGARGTEDAPGLMAALDIGDACEGLVFRIEADQLTAEMHHIFKREMIAPAYLPTMTRAETPNGPIQTLIFAADRDADVIHPDMSHDQKVHYIATGAGFLGSSRAYLEGIAERLDLFGIHDPEVTNLLRDVKAYVPPQG